MRRLAAILVLLVALIAAVHSGGTACAALVMATWTGGGGNDLYTNPDNWDGGVVPFNDATNTYAVVIPGGKTVTLSEDGSFEITDFSLADTSTFNVGSGSTLTVLDEAEIGGLITASNGRFTAAKPGATQLTGTKARLAAVNLGTVEIPATVEIAAMSYSSTGLNAYGSTYTLFSASGNSVLDLSSVQSIDAGFNDIYTQYSTVQRIAATTGGHIDLSGLTTVRAPYRDGSDKLEFIVSDTGSQIDLSGLRIINTAGSGGVEFQINTGGQLLLGDLVQTTNAVFRVQDMSSSLEVSGNLNLSASSELHVAPLGRVAVTRSLLFAQTDETKIDLDDALLHMNGMGPQYLELAGEDSGLPSGPGGSGNFGIGQLVLGESGSPTSASLIDLYDNGNRGTVGAEALYLYGLGGMEGLLIEGGSVLTLNNLNVYAWNTAAGAMQHLNALFEPGEMRIPFDNGYLQLARMDVEWTNVAGGTFATGGNWDKGMPPAGSDSALWNQGSSEGYTVDFANNAASDAAVIKNDTVTFDLGGHEYSLGGLESSYAIVVGQAATDRGSLTVENGTLRGRNLLIGGAGATGELIVAPAARIVLDEDIILGQGDATLRVLAGAAAKAGGDLYLGNGGTVVLEGATLTVGSGPAAASIDTVLVHENASVLGSGSIQGSLHSAGTLTPAGDETIRVSGSLLMEETSLLELVYSGNGQAKPTLDVAGTAVLDGRLSMNFPAETAPDLGTEFVVARSDSLSGAFSAVDGIYPYAGVGMRLVTDEETLSLVVTLRGDLNGDGIVSSKDLDIVRANWGAGVAAGVWASGDATGDGRVGSADLDIVRANWGASATAAAAVPEPGLMVLLFLAGSWLGLARRPRPR